MSDINTPIVFADLLQRCQRVEIPLIQRDYAQGRPVEKDVREGFLKALHAALSLPEESADLPLNLDFIYGSMEGADKQCFLPLDGQQRLTTLFLLHWYLAWLDDCLKDFRSRMWDGKHSRFTYGVRPSSSEFFDAIVSFNPLQSVSQISSVRRHFEDQPWFYLHWRLDPTIQSSLLMLDAIHSRFKDSSGLYSRLVDSQKPVITFQLLPLEHFGLTDDLYIKMNARGKPLTTFETFKARFEDLLHELFPNDTRAFKDGVLSIKEFFSLQMDTQWTRFFWVYKDNTSNTFDQALMNLFWVLIRVSLNPSDPSFSTDTSALRTKSTPGTYTTFHDRGWLSRAFAENLICLLEAWSANGEFTPQLPDQTYFNELAFFKGAVHDPTGVEFSNLILFAGFLFYLKEHEGNVRPESLQEWMRVVFNLTHGSDIEREDFGRCIQGLQKLVPHSQNILRYLAEMEIVPLGFSPQQVREEVLKARLLRGQADWRTHLLSAEKHGYFRGQIEFLLDFSGVVRHLKAVPIETWDDALHRGFQESFQQYLKKSQRMFNEQGLVYTQDELWRRALLVVGDYLLPMGRNYSFITDSASYHDSWKRFLQYPTMNRAFLKSLWDRLDADQPIGLQLNQIIGDTDKLEAWRAAVVRHPGTIAYCGQKEVRRDDNGFEVYLLKKQRMSGAHAELFSYALYLDLITESGRKSIAPLRVSEYESVATAHFEPVVLFEFRGSSMKLSLKLFSNLGKFDIICEIFATSIGALLREKCGFKDGEGRIERATSRDEIHQTLRLIADNLALLDQGGQ
jgi:hypothetical protein